MFARLSTSRATVRGNGKSMTVFDVAVVGGGIVGTATALALIERGWPAVALLEAEGELATHQTGHNSGVMHAGLYYKPGSLKATTCRAGLAMMYRFCEENEVPHRRIGKLVVATNEAQLGALAELERRGAANGLSGIQRLDAGGLREHEPEVAGIAGLFVPETGIVDYRVVTQKLASRFASHGGTIRFASRVVGWKRDGKEQVLETTSGAVRTRHLVNCAGLHSDRVARLTGLEPGIRIVPFRGEYYFLNRNKRHLVRGLVYPVPDPRFPFLGVHFTTTVHGDVEAGPNAVLALGRAAYSWAAISGGDILDMAGYLGFWRMARTHWRTGLTEVLRSLDKRRFTTSLQALIPAIRSDDMSPGGSGIRAQAVDRSGKLLDDFAVLEAPGMVHVLNAPSPAATASLAIAQAIAGRLDSSAPRQPRDPRSRS